jgi:hypothetical protein
MRPMRSPLVAGLDHRLTPEVRALAQFDPSDQRTPEGPSAESSTAMVRGAIAACIMPNCVLGRTPRMSREGAGVQHGEPFGTHFCEENGPVASRVPAAVNAPRASKGA